MANKIQTSFSVATNTGDTTVNNMGKVTVKLTDENNNRLVGVPIDKTLEFRTITDEEVFSEWYAPRTTNTGNYGESSMNYTPTNQGDIIGTFTFTFQGDNTYSGSSIEVELTWSRIPTRIIPRDVTHYATRYTNLLLEDVDWSGASPGTDPNYMNFHGQLLGVESNGDEIPLAGQLVQFINSSGNVCAESLTDGNGVGEARYTRSLTTSTNYKIRFEGTELHAPCITNFRLTTLPRVQVSAEKYLAVNSVVTGREFSTRTGTKWLDDTTGTLGASVENPVRRFITPDNKLNIGYRDNVHFPVFPDDEWTCIVDFTTTSNNYTIQYNNIYEGSSRFRRSNSNETTISHMYVESGMSNTYDTVNDINENRIIFRRQGNNIMIYYYDNQDKLRIVTREYSSLDHNGNLYLINSDINGEVIVSSVIYSTFSPTTAVEGMTPYEVRHGVPFNFGIKLTDEDGAVVSGVPVKIEYGDLRLWNGISHSNGVVRVNNYTPLYGDDTVTITGTFDEDDYIDKYLPVTFSFDVKLREFLRTRTYFKLVTNYGTVNVNENAKVTVKLFDENDNPLIGFPVYKTLSFTSYDGEPVLTGAYSPRTTNTGNYGESSMNYTSSLGDVTGLFTFTYEGDNDYSDASYEDVSHWDKYSVNLSPKYVSQGLEATQEGRITVKLTDMNNNLLVGMPIYKEGVISNAMGDVVGTYTPRTSITSEYGTVTLFHTSNVGSVVGAFTFTYEGSDVYRGFSIDVYLWWSKIPTQLTAENVTHYATRYTNLLLDDSLDWSTASAGTDPSYMNFRAVLEATDTSTDVTTISGEVLKFINSEGNVCAEGVTDNNGVGKARYTHSLPTTAHYKVKYEGSDVYEPCEAKFVLTTLPRVTVTLDEWTKSDTPDEFRRGIPFSFGAVLRENGVPLAGVPGKIYYSDGYQWSVISYSNGVFRVNDFITQNEGSFTVDVIFNESDLIDKYAPAYCSYDIIILKDDAVLSFVNLPYTSTTSTGNLNVQVRLTSSNDNALVGRTVYWYENLGDSADGFRWDYVNSSLTNSTGIATCTFSPRSGVRLIRVIYKDDMEYNSGRATSYTNYNYTKKYGFSTNIPVVNGVAEYTLPDLPLGLYDLKIEYVGTNTSDECCEYGSAVEYVGINRKIGTQFTLDTSSPEYNSSKGYYEEEVTRQFSVKAKLKNEYNNTLTNTLVTTDVNDNNSVNILTDSNGDVVRHHSNNLVDVFDEFNFVYGQTRKNAGNVVSVMGHTIPLTPTISYITPDNYEYFIDDVDPTVFHKNHTVNGNTTRTLIPEEEYLENIVINNYISNDFPLKNRAFYYTRKYDRFGEEVHKNSQGDVYTGHTSAGVVTYYIWDGTNKTNTTQQVYNSAERYHIYTPITSSNMVWRNGNANSANELTRTVTNTSGVGSATYLRKTLNLINFYVSIIDNKYIDSNYKFRQPTNTLPKIVPVLTNKSMSTSHYKEPCTLNCYLKDDENKPLSGKSITFNDSSGNKIGTAVTDNTGYCEVSYTPTVGRNFKYTAVFSGSGIYDSKSQSFTVTNDKQYPLLTVKGSATSIEYGETYTCTVNVSDSNKSSPKNPLKEVPVYVYILSEANEEDPTYSAALKTYVGMGYTNSSGNVSVSFKVNTTGRYNIWAFYNGDYRNPDDQSEIISNNSLYHWAWNATSLITFAPKSVSFANSSNGTCDGGVYGTHTIQLVDKNGTALSNYSVLVQVLNSSNGNVRKANVTSNSSGVVGVTFVGSSPGSNFTNMLPVNISSNNVNKTYTIKYSFNTSDASCVRYEHYGSATQNVEYKFTKIPTRFETPYIDDETFNIKLVRKNGGTAISGKSVKFTEGNVNVTKTTNSNGIATLTGTDVSGGNHTFNISFTEDSTCLGCSTTGKWVNSFVEDCTSLATFTPLAFKWYSTKENTKNYNTSSTKTVKLRTQCNSLFSEGYIDSTDGVHTRTGVVMRCNSIATSSSCDITFKLKLISNRSDGGFGGHFGLMKPSSKDAENAPSRFELYKTGSGYFNHYYIHNNNYNSVKRFNMNFKMNTWYNMCFKVRGTNTTCCNLDTGEEYTGYTGNVVGLNPYIAVFLNSCEIVVREIKLEQK